MGRKSIESAVQLRPVGRNRTRPKYYYCVCRCTPDYGVTNMDTHLLDWTVSRGFHAVCCAKIPRMKAWKGMRLGDLCYEAGFPLRALRIWERTLHQILDADYQWVYTPLNPAYVRWADVVSEYEASLLGQRMDQLWTRVGHPEMGNHAASVTWQYRNMWEEKYYESL